MEVYFKLPMYKNLKYCFKNKSNFSVQNISGTRHLVVEILHHKDTHTITHTQVLTQTNRHTQK